MHNIIDHYWIVIKISWKFLNFEINLLDWCVEGCVRPYILFINNLSTRTNCGQSSWSVRESCCSLSLRILAKFIIKYPYDSIPLRFLIGRRDKVKEYSRGVRKMLKGGTFAFEVSICIGLKHLWTFWEGEVFRKLIYIKWCGSENFRVTRLH